MPLHSAIIDGEAVVRDDERRSSFSARQAALGISGRDVGEQRAAAVIYAFNLLFFDGRDMWDWSFANRLAALKTIGGPKSPAILLYEGCDGSGSDLFTVAGDQGLEGNVSKRRDLP